jgi:hypothetical protein
MKVSYGAISTAAWHRFLTATNASFRGSQFLEIGGRSTAVRVGQLSTQSDLLAGEFRSRIADIHSQTTRRVRWTCEMQRLLPSDKRDDIHSVGYIPVTG